MLNEYVKKGAMGCAFFFGISFTALFLFLVYWSWNNDRQEKKISKDIDIKIQSQLDVSENEEFLIEINISNKSDNKYILNDIDIPPEYFGGIGIFDSQPQFYDHFLGVASGNKNYKFNVVIPPQETTNITLFAFAEIPGQYRSIIDVCINSSSICFGKPIKTNIKATTN